MRGMAEEEKEPEKSTRRFTQAHLTKQVEEEVVEQSWSRTPSWVWSGETKRGRLLGRKRVGKENGE